MDPAVGEEEVVHPAHLHRGVRHPGHRARAHLGAGVALEDRGIRAQRGKSKPLDQEHTRKANGRPSSSSAIAPSYGGGRYYGGGSATAYRAGGRSPSGIVPFALLGAGLIIFPGLWLYGAYAYNYDHSYTFHNATSNRNQTLPVTCLCEQYSACGCDNNDNTTYLNSVVGDGTPSTENSSLVHIGDVNGTKTIVLNGTLPNGTDNSTTSDSTTTSGAVRTMVENSGYWVAGAIVGATVWLL